MTQRNTTEQIDFWNCLDTCCIAILLYGLFPLIPVIIDRIFRNFSDQSSVLINAAMYLITISLITRFSLIFFLNFFLALLLVLSHGNAIDSTSSELVINWAIRSFFIELFILSLERVYLHIHLKEPLDISWGEDLLRRTIRS